MQEIPYILGKKSFKIIGSCRCSLKSNLLTIIFGDKLNPLPPWNKSHEFPLNLHKFHKNHELLENSDRNPIWTCIEIPTVDGTETFPVGALPTPGVPDFGTPTRRSSARTWPWWGFDGKKHWRLHHVHICTYTYIHTYIYILNIYIYIHTHVTYIEL